ncbi:hypothetical protein [Actinomyces minihominis]|uniref:hypothetical protein n=1 Tax=Actinomyces minihominis TaxID=2002838 RepID=UPI00101AE8A0|nr:hypothetical protein [Actinomyces minihominis]
MSTQSPRTAPIMSMPPASPVVSQARKGTALTLLIASIIGFASFFLPWVTLSGLSDNYFASWSSQQAILPLSALTATAVLTVIWLALPRRSMRVAAGVIGLIAGAILLYISGGSILTIIVGSGLLEGDLGVGFGLIISFAVSIVMVIFGIKALVLPRKKQR